MSFPWSLAVLASLGVGPPAAWPPDGVPEGGRVKEIAAIEVPSPSRIAEIRIDWAGGPGDLTVHVWRDIGSRVRPYWPYRHFEFDLTAPVRVRAGAGRTVVPTAGLEVRNGERLFVGAFVRRDGPRFATAGVDGREALIELPIADDARTAPTLMEVPGGFAVTASHSPALPDTPRLFEDVTERAGLSNQAGSVFAWADLDGDGFEDLVLDGSRVFLNRGGLRFEKAEAGWPPDDGSATLAVFADIEGDGDLDAFVGDRSGRTPARILVSEGRGRFSPGPRRPVLRAPTFAASWFDADQDGDPDLLIANGWTFVRGVADSPDALWINEGPAGFRDASARVAGAGPLFSRASVAADWTGDARAHAFVGAFRQLPDRLWRFGGGAATDLAGPLGMTGLPSRIGGRVDGHALGADAGDLDGDGLLDLLVSNLVHPDWRGFAHSAPSAAFFRRAGGALAFRHSPLTDLGFPFEESPANATMADFDGDGRLDVVWNSLYHVPRLVLNRPTGFVERTLEAGLLGEGGEGVAWCDFDQDGRIDLVLQDKRSGLRLLRNIGPQRLWAGVRLRASPGGPTPVGAVVVFRVGGRSYVRWVSGGSGQAQQNSAVAIVHLPPGHKEVEVEVEVRPLGSKPVPRQRVKTGKVNEITLHADQNTR